METDYVKAGEIIQSVKCPLGKHDNLSSIPSIYIEKASSSSLYCHTSPREIDSGEFLEPAGQPV